MVTTLTPKIVRPATGQAGSVQRGSTRVDKPMAPEFRLLGLRPREARVEVIRQAVQSAASLPATLEDDQQLAAVATAGYHLLDPRRRRSLFERVQLLLWTEDDLDPIMGTWWDAETSAAELVAQPMVVAKPASNPVPPPVASGVSAVPATSLTSAAAASPNEETQAAFELFRSMRQRDRRATALWIGIVGLALSLTLALALVTTLLNT